MIRGAMAQKIAVAVGKIVARHAVEELGGKVVRFSYDVTEAVGEIVFEEYGQKGKQGGKLASSDIVAVMAGMSPSDVSRSVEAALASPELREITASMTPEEKDGVRQRAIGGLFDVRSLFGLFGKLQAIATADRPEPQVAESAGSAGAGDLGDTLGQPRADLHVSLERGDYAQARVHADAILAEVTANRDELLGFMQRLDGMEARAAADRPGMDGVEGRPPDVHLYFQVMSLKRELTRSLGQGDFEHVRSLANAILAISPAEHAVLAPVLQRLDEAEQRAAAERARLDASDEAAARVRRWAERRGRRVMLAWDLMTSLRKGEYGQVRGRADAMLALLNADCEEIVALLQRLDEIEARAAAGGRQAATGT